MYKMDYSSSYYDDDGSENNDIIHCYCQDHCPFGDDRGVCTTKPGGKCFTSVEASVNENGEEIPILSYGCLPANEMAFLQCKASLVPHAESKSIQCCDEGDFCNKNLFPMYAIKEETTPPTPDKLPFIMLTSSLVCCLFILGIALTVVFIKYRRKLRDVEKIDPDFNCDVEQYGANHNEANDIRENEMLENLANFLEPEDGVVHRTIAKQIDLEKCVGEGRFGAVWLGRWREEKVAVKIFLKTEIQAWHRELEIYQTVLMRHDNILGFIAADITGEGTLLITEYHPFGSLFLYLQGHTLNPTTLLTMSRSVARGLAYLHTEIFGINGKPALAHKDLQSQNVLVKNNGECCIADFTLAVKFNSSFHQIEQPRSVRVGNKRYMAPEILDGSFDVGNFDAHKMADMYSLGLVLWEMTRRCVFKDEPPLEYSVPFQGLVPDNPTSEDMREVVCTQKIRPQVLEVLNGPDVLKIIVKVIRELWHGNPAVRLTALRVKKTLLEFKPIDS